MDIKQIGLEGLDWIRLAQDRDMWGAVVNANIGVMVNRDKCKFGASGTYAWYLVWHCFWSGAVYRI